MKVDRKSFYAGKALVKVEWWLSYCSEYPDFAWGRLRVYSDSTADAAFEPSKVYGFDSREFASYFLSEDEYMPFDTMDEQDAADIGAKLVDISPPTWADHVSEAFEYLGKY